VKKEDKEQLRKARRALSEAAFLAHELSRKVGNFEESKPLNILGKEIDALKYAVTVMSGEEKLKSAELKDASWLHRVPDCLTIWFNLNE
jgi:hypothetical protein